MGPDCLAKSALWKLMVRVCAHQELQILSTLFSNGEGWIKGSRGFVLEGVKGEAFLC